MKERSGSSSILNFFGMLVSTHQALFPQTKNTKPKAISSVCLRTRVGFGGPMARSWWTDSDHHWVAIIAYDRDHRAMIAIAIMASVFALVVILDLIWTIWYSGGKNPGGQNTRVQEHTGVGSSIFLGVFSWSQICL